MAQAALIAHLKLGGIIFCVRGDGGSIKRD